MMGMVLLGIPDHESAQQGGLILPDILIKILTRRNRKMKPYAENLFKTLELTDLSFTLKKAYLKSRFTDETEKEIRKRIFESLLIRKEKQWKSAKVFLKH